MVFNTSSRNDGTVPGKNKELLEALPAFWRVLGIFRGLYIRPDVGHRETLVFGTGAGRALPEVLLALVESKFLSAIETDVFARAHFLPCTVGLLFGQMIHQNSHSRQRYIWIVFVHPRETRSFSGRPGREEVVPIGAPVSALPLLHNHYRPSPSSSIMAGRVIAILGSIDIVLGEVDR